MVVDSLTLFVRACKIGIVRRTDQSCFGDGYSTVKKRIEGRESKRRVLGSVVERESQGRESQYCLLVREGMSPFVV